MLIALLSPTGDMCDAYADDLVIDFDQGVIVIDAATGEELSGTICSERGSTFETVDSSIGLVVGGEILGTHGTLEGEGELCVTVDDVLTCACVDSNHVHWTQSCAGHDSCAACCLSNGGHVKIKVAIHLNPPSADD